VVSIGQGTTEIVVIDDMEIIDGESSRWASDFVTRKIGRYAHLDTDLLHRNQDVCQRYSRIMARTCPARYTTCPGSTATGIR